jgi:predicted phosphatase
MKEQKTKKVIRKVKKSGVVKLKPRIISEVKKDRSLIVDHIVEATGKAQAVEKNIFIKAYIYVGKKWNKFINNMFGM